MALESDTSADYNTSQKKREQLKQNAAAVNNKKCKAAKIICDIKLRNRQIKIKQKPQDDVSTDLTTPESHQPHPKKPVKPKQNIPSAR